MLGLSIVDPPRHAGWPSEFSAVSIFQNIPVSACLQGGKEYTPRCVDRQHDDLRISIDSFVSLIASRPVIRGMGEVKKNHVGLWSEHSDASSPSPASPTIFNSGWEERSDFRPSLRMVWSSAITILNAFS